MKNILVTGACGGMGSTVCRLFNALPRHLQVNLIKHLLKAQHV